MAAGASSANVAPTFIEEQNFVAFDHVAAGHEGVQSDASNGYVIAKPCTAEEIAFYQSAAQHKAFKSHMPDLYGTLTPLAPSAGALDALAALEGQHAMPASLQGGPETIQALTNGASTPPSHHSHRSTPSILQNPVSKRTSWQPSGGKKINTGLAIVLENVAHGFVHPNILDVKLGARLWADDAPASKRQKLDDASRQTTSGSLGFRIAGMTVWKGTSADDHPEEPPEKNVEFKNGYKHYLKKYGWTFTKENVKIGFIEYFGGATSDGKLKARHSKLIIKRIARELESIINVLEHEESRMYSASILFVYEGDEQALESALQEEKIRHIEEQGQNLDARPSSTAVDKDNQDDDDDDDDDNDDDDDENDDDDPKIHDVRLIDFAHAQWTPGQGPDENALQGVRMVLKILNEIAG